MGAWEERILNFCNRHQSSRQPLASSCSRCQRSETTELTAHNDIGPFYILLSSGTRTGRGRLYQPQPFGA